MSIQVIESVEITPVPLDRVLALRNGRTVAITADAGSIAVQLQEIDDRFRLSYSPDQMLFMLELHIPQPDGSTTEHFVGAYEELDGRLLHRARKITSEGYNIADEMERAEREADARHEHRRREQLGDVAEKLTFALQRDLGRHEIATTPKSRAFIPAFRP